MSQVSAPIRAVALIGMLAALAVGAWSFMGGHGAATSAGSASTDSSVAAVAKNPVAAAQAVAGKLSAHNNATAAGNVAGAEAATSTKPAAKPAAAPAKASTPASTAKPATAKPATAKPATAKPAKPAKTTKKKNATRMTIASLLVSHPAVVVLLYDPQSKVDAYSLGEAQLGASRANAGFVAIDVLNQRQVGSFTEAYGVLQDPSVLFFARPGKLVQKLSGFADHDTVAQAAINAEVAAGASAHTLNQSMAQSAPKPTHSLKEWAAAVNSVCVAQGNGPIAPPNPSAAEQAAYAHASDRWMAKAIAATVAVPLPSARAARTTAEQFITLLKKSRTELVAYLQANAQGDHVKANTALAAANADGDREASIARSLNMTACQ